MKRVLAAAIGAGALAAVGGVVLAQSTGVNPVVGSVWTYLGATYGAGWVVPQAVSSGYVSTNAGLAVTTLTTTQVYRAGFYAPGDGGAMTYTHQVGACSLNGGNGDNGSQVKAADGGCWIADFSGMQPTPLVWGAKGDGAIDDRVPVQAAIDALPGKTLYLGGRKYCIGAPGLVVYKAMAIEGDVPGYPWDSTHPNFPNYGFVACAVNLNMLTFGTNGTNVSAGSRLSGVFFDAGAAGTNTSGVAITANQTSLLKIDHVVVYRACIGIDERMSNNDRISQVLIRGDGTQMAAGCGGVRVGAGSTGGQLTDLKLDSVTSDVKGDWGLWIQDAGGLQIHNADILFATNGTLIKPGANQVVSWLFADNSALGDTTCASAMLIDTAAATSVVKGLTFNGTWAASASGAATGCLGGGVQIQNTGPAGAVVRGIHFLGHRSYNNGREGFILQPNIFDVTIDNSMICGNSTQTGLVPANHYAGIALGDGVVGVAIRNNRISPSCAYTPDIVSQTTGIFMVGNNYALTIIGNDFNATTNPLSGLPPLPSGFTVIANNNGVETMIDSIAAAATLPLGLGVTAAMTGASVTVANITGMWPGREVYLLARDNNQTFATGGAVSTRLCVARTLNAGQMALARSLNGFDCIYVFPP